MMSYHQKSNKPEILYIKKIFGMNSWEQFIIYIKAWPISLKDIAMKYVLMLCARDSHN